MLGWFLTHQPTFELWQGFYTKPPMRLFTLLMLALVGHAWVGMWTVLTDYVKSNGFTFCAAICHDSCSLWFIYFGRDDFLLNILLDKFC